MAFKKYYREFNDYSEEIEYLRKIGYKTYFGTDINNYYPYITADRENDCFILSCGCTNPNRDNEHLYFYVLCIRGIPLTLTLEENNHGKAAENSAEFHYIILKIEYPEGHTAEEFDNLEKIITEAFYTESFSEVFTPERVKEITVEFNLHE